MKHREIRVTGKIGASNFMVVSRFIPPLALAFFSISAVSSPALAADLYYYDGAIKRKLTIDPSSSGKSTSGDRPVGKSTGDSPVFRASAAGSTGSPTGPAMALPGGVILVPKDPNNEAKLMASLRAKGLEIERPIGNSGAYLIRSKQGMAALELANQLHESGEFESVSPNWKRERTKK
jgi:hypothetical protein